MVKERRKGKRREKRDVLVWVEKDDSFDRRFVDFVRSSF
jgi:hypothetical protein